LLQRIHPAASRVQRLAAETPAIYLVFDLLAAEDGHSLLNQPLSKRRNRLEGFAAAYFHKDSIRLSPATLKLVQARKWLAKTGPTLDGIIAKRRDMDYRSGQRDGMQKIKNFRSADCVVGGFRYPKLVVEVCFDHVTANRFRHGTKLLRWRPDKAPETCAMDQLAQKQSNLLRLLD
jgi:ATP-dependent DNA ligase